MGRVTMGSRKGESTSGSSTDSIDRDVLGRHASRSLSSQPEGNIETVIISSDSEPSGNSETTNRNETAQDPLSVSFSPLMFESQPNETSNVGTQSGEPSENSEPTTQVFYCCHTGRPLIFESQYSESSNLSTQSQEPSENSETTTQDPCVASPLKFESQYSESSNVGTQSEDPNKCRQIFATESDTQCKFVLVCPEDADESNENPDESTENVDESTENADETTENVNESTENADEYVRGSDTQDISQEMYPDTLSQSSEPLPRSARRRVQIYEFASEPSSDPLDSTYVPPACEIPPPLRREYAITPSTSSKHDLDSTEVDSDENEPPKKKKKEKKKKVLSLIPLL